MEGSATPQPYAWGIVNEWADINVANPPFAQADQIIAAPSIDLDMLRSKLKRNGKVLAYIESIMIPTKQTDVNQFYLDLQEAMHYAPPFAAFWLDDHGKPINFWTESWPQSRIIPKNTHADWLVDFIVASDVIRPYDGIYLDDFTKEVPRYIYEQLPINWQDAATLQTLQKDHAHYVNRLASGLRARMPAEFLLEANTAKFTHPALDSITVEQETKDHPGSTRQDCINACKNQIAHGMNRLDCVIWSGEGEPGTAIEGVWPE